MKSEIPHVKHGLTYNDVEELREHLITYMEGDTPFVLSSWILDKVAFILFRKDSPSLALSVFSTVILVIFFYILTTATQAFVESPPLRHSLTFIVLCFLGGFSLLVVKFAHKLGFGPIARNLAIVVTDSEDLTYIHEWLRKILSPHFQLIVSTVWGIVGFTLAILFFPSNVLDGHSQVAFAVAGFLSQFCSGQGFYWGYVFPLLWKQIGKSDLNLIWLNPSKTPQLRRIASVTNAYTLILSTV